MPEKLDDLVENVRELSGWVRVLFVIFFIVVLYLMGPLIVLLALAQGLFLIFTAKANENLAGFGALLAIYAAQILNFVTFHSERRPFPFSDFPDGHVEPAEVAGVDAEPSNSMSAAFSQEELKAERGKPAKKVSKKAASKQKAVRKKKASGKVAKKAQ